VYICGYGDGGEEAEEEAEDGKSTGNQRSNNNNKQKKREIYWASPTFITSVRSRHFSMPPTSCSKKNDAPHLLMCALRHLLLL